MKGQETLQSINVKLVATSKGRKVHFDFNALISGRLFLNLKENKGQLLVKMKRTSFLISSPKLNTRHLFLLHKSFLKMTPICPSCAIVFTFTAAFYMILIFATLLN